MEFKDFILERFSPIVMVISSPEVDVMVGEANGLTVPDLLRPHGFLRHLSGESTDTPLKLIGFRYPRKWSASFASLSYRHSLL